MTSQSQDSLRLQSKAIRQNNRSSNGSKSKIYFGTTRTYKFFGDFFEIKDELITFHHTFSAEIEPLPTQVFFIACSFGGNVATLILSLCLVINESDCFALFFQNYSWHLVWEMLNREIIAILVQCILTWIRCMRI